MRVTHQMLAQNVSRNIQRNLKSLEERSTQLSMGRKFDRPSQDPVGTYKVMGITGTNLARNEQYGRNISEATTWLTVTEDALDNAADIINRLRELSIYTASSTVEAEDMQKVAPEVKELYEQLVSLGNAEVNNLYVFGGHETQKPPYMLANGEEFDLAFEGDGGKRAVEIAPANSLEINITGAAAFGEEGMETFEVVEDMYEALLDGDHDRLGNEIISGLDGALDRLLQCRAEVGAKMGRLESTEERLEGERLYLRELRSKIEDLDVAEAIMELKMQENTYQASLATGSRMIYPSLIDFLQ